jgi:hypothetical protein
MGSNNILLFFLIICLIGGAVLGAIILAMNKFCIKKWMQRIVIIVGVILILFSLPCYLFILYNDSLHPIVPYVTEARQLRDDLKNTYGVDNLYIKAERPFSCVISLDSSKLSKDDTLKIKCEIEKSLNNGLFDKIVDLCKNNYDFLRVPDKNNVSLEISIDYKFVEKYNLKVT